jgi:universal stress protein A
MYKNILVAIDLEGGSEQVLAKAAELAGGNCQCHCDAGCSCQCHQKSNIFLLNVGHFPVPTYAGVYGGGAYGGPEYYIDFNDVRETLLPKLETMAKDSQLHEATAVVEFGRPADLIVEVAERENIDLIVLGSHGKHGVALLLGSTADGVLHHAQCDVLAVRIKKESTASK